MRWFNSTTSTADLLKLYSEVVGLTELLKRARPTTARTFKAQIKQLDNKCNRIREVIRWPYDNLQLDSSVPDTIGTNDAERKAWFVRNTRWVLIEADGVARRASYAIDDLKEFEKDYAETPDAQPRWIRDGRQAAIEAEARRRQAVNITNAATEAATETATQAPVAAAVETADERSRLVMGVFAHTHVRNAYERLRDGRIWLDAMEREIIPLHDPTIPSLSEKNLSRLRSEVTLDEGDQLLLSRVRSLDFTLKHVTSRSAWEQITAGDGLLSLDTLKAIVPDFNSDFTTGEDATSKSDVDFVFFRLGIGTGYIETRYGGSHQIQLTFNSSHLLRNGWITLWDMLEPIDNVNNISVSPEVGDQPATIHTRLINDALPDGATLVRKGTYEDGRQLSDRTKHPWRWRFEYGEFLGTQEHILKHAFWGPDILEGIALSLIRDLHLMPQIRPMFLEAANPELAPQQFWKLVTKLYRIEARVPVIHSFERDGEKIGIQEIVQG